MTSHTTRNSCATQSRIYVTSFFSAQKPVLYLTPMTLLSTQAEEERKGGLQELKEEELHEKYATALN